MNTKSEKITTPTVTQNNKCRELMEESMFFGNSFFLTGKNLPMKNDKTTKKTLIQPLQSIPTPISQ